MEREGFLSRQPLEEKSPSIWSEYVLGHVSHFSRYTGSCSAYCSVTGLFHFVHQNSASTYLWSGLPHFNLAMMHFPSESILMVR